MVNAPLSTNEHLRQALHRAVADMFLVRLPRDVRHSALKAKLLNLCLEEGVVTDKEVKQWIHERIIEVGRANFKRVSTSGVCPDDTGAPWTLAYA